MPNALLKPGEVALTLGISRSLAYQLIRQGAIPFVRISKRAVRVRPCDLEAYIQENILSRGFTPLFSDSQILDRSKISS